MPRLRETVGSGHPAPFEQLTDKNGSCRPVADVVPATNGAIQAQQTQDRVTVGGAQRRLCNFGDKAMTKKPYMLAAALVVATGLVGVKMLVAPPVTLAAQSQGLDIQQLAQSTPGDLPSFDAKYQRHLGVLDVLNAP